jgi:hypothetical protein
MSQAQKIQNSLLAQMSVEDLLELDTAGIELVSDGVLLPSGLYSFTVEECEVGQAGKAGEEKPVITLKLQITGVVELDNPADAEAVATLDLAANPQRYTENFQLTAKDGFGVRSFSTFSAGWSAQTNVTKLGEVIQQLAGAQGATRLQVNTYLPQNKADTPENYKSNNRMKVTETVWM